MYTAMKQIEKETLSNEGGDTFKNDADGKNFKIRPEQELGPESALQAKMDAIRAEHLIKHTR
jgi:hypothetical protein